MKPLINAEDVKLLFICAFHPYFKVVHGQGREAEVLGLIATHKSAAGLPYFGTTTDSNGTPVEPDYGAHHSVEGALRAIIDQENQKNAIVLNANNQQWLASLDFDSPVAVCSTHWDDDYGVPGVIMDISVDRKYLKVRGEDGHEYGPFCAEDGFEVDKHFGRYKFMTAPTHEIRNAFRHVALAVKMDRICWDDIPLENLEAIAVLVGKEKIHE